MRWKLLIAPGGRDEWSVSKRSGGEGRAEGPPEALDRPPKMALPALGTGSLEAPAALSSAAMEQSREYDLIVVGGGIAGGAAALRAAQYLLRTLWIRGDKKTAKRSRGMWVANIDNMIGVHEGIVRKKLLKLLRGEEHAAARERIEAAPHLAVGSRDIIENTVERIEAEFLDYVTIVDQAADGARREGEDGAFVVSCGEQEFRGEAVVLATGVMDRQPSILKSKKGELRDDPKWIYPWANREDILYCIRCEGHLTATGRAAVIGSSEAAAQLAMMLHERYGSACCLLTNGAEPAWSARSQQVLDRYGIGLHRQRLTDFGGDGEGMRTIHLEDGEPVEVRFALVALGLYRVYNELARALGAELADPDKPEGERHVRIDARGETSVPGLFAVGDMAARADEPVMKQVYTSQEYAVRAVDSIDSRRRRRDREAALEQPE